MNAYRNEGKVYEIHVNAKFLTIWQRPELSLLILRLMKEKKENIYLVLNGVSYSVWYTVYKLSYWIILCGQAINLSLKMKKSRLRGPKTKFAYLARWRVRIWIFKFHSLIIIIIMFHKIMFHNKVMEKVL